MNGLYELNVVYPFWYILTKVIQLKLLFAVIVFH